MLTPDGRPDGPQGVDTPALATFRPPWTILLPMLPRATALVFVPLLIYAAWHEQSVVQAVTIVGGVFVIAVLPICLLASVITALLYRVRVHAGGMSSNEPTLGRKEFMPWYDMSEAHAVSVWGMAYVRVDSVAGARLWIPAGVYADPALAAAVISAAPTSRMADWMKNPAQ